MLGELKTPSESSLIRRVASGGCRTSLRWNNFPVRPEAPASSSMTVSSTVPHASSPGGGNYTTYRHQHHSFYVHTCGIHYTKTPVEFTILRHLRHSRYIMDTCSTHSIETPATLTVQRETPAAITEHPHLRYSLHTYTPDNSL